MYNRMLDSHGEGANNQNGRGKIESPAAMANPKEEFLEMIHTVGAPKILRYAVSLRDRAAIRISFIPLPTANTSLSSAFVR